MEDFSRYNRQLLLPGFGTEKQKLLSDARVLVIGAGGLGCPVLLYLTAAGVGTIGIVDGDTVELSNLHRQVLFSESDIGKSKALTAVKKLQDHNQQVKFETFNFRLTRENAVSVLESFDLVIDGSDNFPTRYLVNDVCVLMDKPLVYGSIYRFEGQVAVFNVPDDKGLKTNYRDLFPETPDPDQIPNCAEAGVLGVLPGIIGSLQANEAIKIISGLGKPLINRILTFNTLSNVTYTLDLYPHPNSSSFIPKSLQEISKTDYEVSCEFINVENVPAEELMDLLESNPHITLLDVRESFEMPKLQGFPYTSIPLGELTNRMGELKGNQEILVFCQSGKRSIQAAEIIKQNLQDIKLYNLDGGMNKWVETKMKSR
jgi:sulfur-carrier protein adenylyltransferase/sulfurtransferase